MGEPNAARQRTRAILLLIVLLAAGLRLYGLGTYSLWYDEAASIVGIQYVDTDLSFLRADESRLIPLNTFLLFLWHGVVSNTPGVEMGSQGSDFLLRLMPALFSLLLVPLTFRCARYLLRSDSASLIAALLVAISPLHVYYAQELRPHSLYALLTVAALYHTLRALEEDRRKDWILLVAWSVLSFYAYYFAAVYLVCINIFVFLNWKTYGAKLKKWIASQVAVVILLVPAAILALQIWTMHSAAEEHWFPQPTLKTAALTLKNYFAGYSPNAPVYWVLFILASLLALEGLWFLRKQRRTLGLLLCMSALPIALQILVWATQDFAFYTYRAQLPCSVAVYMLIGHALVTWRPRWLMGVEIAALLALTAPLLADHYAQRLHPVWHHLLGARYKVDTRGAAEYIRARKQPGDVIAHSATFTIGPFLYHYLPGEQSVLGFTDEERRGFLASFPDEKMWASVGYLPKRVEDVVGEADRVWFVQSWWEPNRPIALMHELRGWLDAHAVRVDREWFDGVWVYLYDFRPKRETGAVEENRVADAWFNTIPHYRFSDADAFPEIQSEFEGNFAKQYELNLRQFPHALSAAFDFQITDRTPRTGETLLASSPGGAMNVVARFPNENGQSMDYTVVFTNYEDQNFQLSLRTLVSVDALEFIEFDREAGSDVWRPTSNFHGRIAMTARLDEATPRGVLRTSTRLPEGRYAVFARVQVTTDKNVAAQLTLSVSIGDGSSERLGTISTAGPTGEWVWRSLGELSASQDPIALTLSAHLAEGQREAQASIERIVFLPADSGPPMPETVDVLVVAGAAKNVDGKIADAIRGIKRVDIEMYDQFGGVRSLHFHVQDPERIDQ